MNIALLFGGQSFEHKVSLVSAAYILRELAALKHTIYPIAITTTGAWVLTDVQQQVQHATQGRPLKVPDSSDNSKHVWTVPSDGVWYNRARPTKLDIDCVFPVVHGYGGEDGKLQGLLSIADLPFTGCGCTTSALSMNKHIMKSVLHCHKFPVVPWVSFSQSEYNTKKHALISSCIESLGFPLLIKPADGGSTIGVSKAHSLEELHASIETCFQYTNIALVEQYLCPVREIEMAVIQKNTSVATFPPGEIITPKGAIYDYSLKYNTKAETRLEIPAPLSPSLVHEITELSTQVCALLHCEGFARLDFFLTQDNAIYINELNTIPGFTQNSMFPLLATQELCAGELIQSILNASIVTYAQNALVKKRIQQHNDEHR